MVDAPIKIDGLCKSYARRGGGKVRALDGVSFEVGRGETFGLIGPDGAGKTTLMRIVTSLILPDGGGARVLGFDCAREYAKVRARIGYMPGRFSLYEDLSVAENLEFFASVFGVKVSDNIDLVEGVYGMLRPLKNRRAGKLSGGMKQKLALCCALIHRPEVLILDEPTTGVDPVSRQELWEALARLRGGGISILVSTPYMDEAARCGRIAFLSGGKILVCDTPENIAAGFKKSIVHVRGADMFGILKSLRECPQVESAYAFGDSNHAVLRAGHGGGLKNALAQKGHAGVFIEEARANLEDCFMAMEGGDEGD